MPFGHFAFDDAGCGPGPAGGVESGEDPAQERQPAVVVVFGWSGGEIARVGDGPSGDPQRGGEADPVGVVAGVAGGVGHQGRIA